MGSFSLQSTGDPVRGATFQLSCVSLWFACADIQQVGRLCLQINASSRCSIQYYRRTVVFTQKTRDICFHLMKILLWDESLNVTHAIGSKSIGSLRSHERARPRCDYWYFPLQSADRWRQPKHVCASCCLGGANGNSRQDINNGGLHRLWSLVVCRFEPTLGIISIYPIYVVPTKF